MNLFLALAAVYLVGIVGIVVVGTLVETPDQQPANLEQRLASVRAIAPPDDTTAAPPPHQYFVRARRRN